MMPALRQLSYEDGLKQRKLATFGNGRIRGDQIETFKLRCGFENIDKIKYC